MVAERIEETESYKILVNMCDEKSKWTYDSEVRFHLILLSTLLLCSGQLAALV